MDSGNKKGKRLSAGTINISAAYNPPDISTISVNNRKDTQQKAERFLFETSQLFFFTHLDNITGMSQSSMIR